MYLQFFFFLSNALNNVFSCKINNIASGWRILENIWLCIIYLIIKHGFISITHYIIEHLYNIWLKYR